MFCKHGTNNLNLTIREMRNIEKYVLQTWHKQSKSNNQRNEKYREILFTI